jgi:hypothetical protein
VAEHAVPAAASQTGHAAQRRVYTANAANHGSYRTEFTSRLDSASVRTSLDGSQAQTEREAAAPTTPTAKTTQQPNQQQKPSKQLVSTVYQARKRSRLHTRNGSNLLSNFNAGKRSSIQQKTRTKRAHNLSKFATEKRMVTRSLRAIIYLLLCILTTNNLRTRLASVADTRA